MRASRRNWSAQPIDSRDPERKRLEQSADEVLELEIELHNDAVGAARQPNTGTDVVLDSVRQLAFQHREDVVLLRAQRTVVVDQAERAIKFDAGGNLAQVVVVDARGVAALD